MLNKLQEQFCQSTAQNIRLLAPAGSGKTQSILWRCKMIHETQGGKQKFLIFTFTRIARNELRLRLLNNPEFKELKDFVKIETLNQWGYNYIKQNKNGISLKTKKNDLFFLMNNTLRPIWENNLPSLSQKSKSFKEIFKIMVELKTLGFTHTGTESDFLDAFLIHFDWICSSNLENYFEKKILDPLINLELADLEKGPVTKRLKSFLLFWKKASESLWSQSIITLEDQKYFSLHLLNETYSSNRQFLTPNRYQHIIVDEFQDINPLDLLLIQKLNFLCSSSLTVVGDDDQAIYEWRGSSPKFIVEIDKFFNKKFESHILEMNYRSPENIVNLAKKLISKNKFRVKKDTTAFNKKRAEVAVKSFPIHVDGLDFILDFINKTIKENNESIAIISRKKGQLIPIQILLTSANIEYYAKEDLNILLSDAFNELKDLLLIYNRKQQSREIEEIYQDIEKCFNLIGTYPMKKEDRSRLKKVVLKLQTDNFNATLSSLISNTDKLNGKEIGKQANEIQKAFLKKQVSGVIDLIGSIFQGLQKHYIKSEDDIYYKEPPFIYLSDYAVRYKDDFKQFISHLKAAILKMQTNIDENSDEFDVDEKNQVHLMTALRTKGKEFDNVFILDANDGIWPIKFAKTDEELEQERRLFYVALTRTKQRIFFLTSDRILDKQMNISPYLLEMKIK